MRHGEQWYLAADAGDPVGEQLLSSPLITSPDQDTARLHEASLEEVTDAPPPGSPAPVELTDPDAPAMAQLRDLSVADDRFEPTLVQTALEHIVEAWERSADGSDAPLLAVATGAGASARTARCSAGLAPDRERGIVVLVAAIVGIREQGGEHLPFDRDLPASLQA